MKKLNSMSKWLIHSKRLRSTKLKLKKKQLNLLLLRNNIKTKEMKKSNSISKKLRKKKN